MFNVNSKDTRTTLGDLFVTTRHCRIKGRKTKHTYDVRGCKCEKMSFFDNFWRKFKFFDCLERGQKLLKFTFHPVCMQYF